jgi:hypothetical protein
MPNITLKTDHLATGLRRLLEQYKDKLQFEALLSSYLKEVQVLENAIWEVYLGRLYPFAEGVQLDMLGKLIGEKRDGRTDTIYRKWIAIRVRINRSVGKELDLRGLLDSDFNDGAIYAMLSFTETPPAFFIIEIKNDADLIADHGFTFIGADVARIVDEAKAAGVGWAVYQRTVGEDDFFTFKNLGAGDVAAQGFGDSVSGGIGGFFSHVYQG